MEQTHNSRRRFRPRHLFPFLILLLAAALAILPFALDKLSASAGSGASIHSAAVVRADLSRTVSGAGTLAAKDAAALTVPAGVTVTGYAVSEGDIVKAGDPIAYVDTVSVYKAAADVSDMIASVTESLAALQEAAAEGGVISAPGYALVTRVCAQTGDDVRTVMQQYGALCELMLEDGTVLRVTGTGGTVAWCNIAEGSIVYDGAPLYSITGLDSTVGYGSLVLTRQKLEAQLAQLFRMLRDGYAAAPLDGMVTGLDESLVVPLSAGTGSGLQIELLSSVRRNDTSAQGMLDALLEEAPGITVPTYGTLTSALDSLGQGYVTTVDGQKILVSFGDDSDARTGDTVILEQVSTLDAYGEVTDISYDLFMVIPADDDSEGGSGSSGDSGGESAGSEKTGGSGGSSGSSSGKTTGTASASAAASVETADTVVVSVGTTQIASVVPMDEVLVRITVDELDILTLHAGDTALVTIDALPGHAYEGTVTGVNTGSTNTGGNSKYIAELTLPRSDGMLAGMNASCLITVETLKDVLTVPAEALLDESGGSYIYTAVSRDGQTLTDPVRVVAGFSDGETVEILSGLSDGDTVWYSVYDTPEYSVSGARQSGSVLDGLLGGGRGGMSGRRRT